MFGNKKYSLYYSSKIITSSIYFLTYSDEITTKQKNENAMKNIKPSIYHIYLK